MSGCRCGDCKWRERGPGREGLEWRRCRVPLPKWAVRAIVFEDADDEQHVNDTQPCDTFAALDAEVNP